MPKINYLAYGNCDQLNCSLFNDISRLNKYMSQYLWHLFGRERERVIKFSLNVNMGFAIEHSLKPFNFGRFLVYNKLMLVSKSHQVNRK